MLEERLHFEKGGLANHKEMIKSIIKVLLDSVSKKQNEARIEYNRRTESLVSQEVPQETTSDYRMGLFDPVQQDVSELVVDVITRQLEQIRSV